MTDEFKPSGISQLDQVGGLVSSTPVARPITFNGKTVNFYFRELPYLDVEKALEPADGKSTNLAFLAHVLTDELGQDRVTKDQIDRIKPGLVKMLLKAAFDVNGVGRSVEDDAGK